MCAFIIRMKKELNFEKKIVADQLQGDIIRWLEQIIAYQIIFQFHKLSRASKIND